MSGSTSLFIRKNSRKFGRRTMSFAVRLFFPEYLKFVEKEEILDKLILYQAELNKEFTIYLQSQFIETIK